MREFTKYDYTRLISNSRQKDDLESAIEYALCAKKEYTEENIFCKLLGDLYFQIKDYDNAWRAYVEFIYKIGDNIQYIKHFANFLNRYAEVVNESEVKENVREIYKYINKTGRSEQINIALCEIISPYIDITEINLFSNDTNFEKVKNYVSKIENSYMIYILYDKILKIEHTEKSKNIDKFLVSSLERKKQYLNALNLITKVLTYDTDQVAIRTLFRICRKLNDYSEVEKYIQLNPQIEQAENFNVLYELVFYYSNTGEIVKRNEALEKIEICGRKSIPILRTLYNFYIQFGMIDKAKKTSYLVTRLEEQTTKKAKTEREEQEKDAFSALIIKFTELLEEVEHSRTLISMSELLKGFSHELGQPITNIRYSIQLYQMKIEKGLDNVEDLDKLFIDLLSQTKRIEKLLSRFSPLVSGKQETCEFSVASRINMVFNEFNPRLAKDNIDFKLDLQTDFSLKGDSVKFDQIIYNLIGNAIYAIKEKNDSGSIYVEMSENVDCYKIEFSDDGIGIPTEYVNKIFEPFFTTKEKVADETGGEGLGLYIIWNIVRMFNGNIRVDKRYRKGARFIIEFVKKGNE